MVWPARRFALAQQGTETVVREFLPLSESPARPMPLFAPHDLAGLIAWSRRAEWQAPFGTLLDGHVGNACACAGLKSI